MCLYQTAFMLYLEKQSPFIVRTIRNTQIHCVGRMQSFSVLKRVVHIVTTGLLRVKLSELCPC
jgi:hypothetical protein